MNTTRPYPDEPVPLRIAARYLRIPARWLRQEVEGGRLPGLRADRAILVHLPTVSARLADIAKQPAATGQEGGK